MSDCTLNISLQRPEYKLKAATNGVVSGHNSNTNQGVGK